MSAVERFAAAVARLFTLKVRFWLYGIGVAAFGVLAVRGAVSVEETGSWLLLLSAVFGVTQSGMAALNSRRPKAPDDLG